jgi:dTMP kinase
MPALYVFEGPDGVGKTTLASHLNGYLAGKGFRSDLCAFPGREIGTVGEHIYRLYHQPELFGINRIPVATEQLLFVASHVEAIQNQILPALSEGKNVLLDRYWWSTWVYSTLAGLPPRIRDLLVELELEVWQDIRPRIIFLLSRNPNLRQGSEKRSRLVSLYESLRLRQLKGPRVVVVDNNGTVKRAVEYIAGEIIAAAEANARKKPRLRGTD